jgi:CheY-like chemotaxis protein
VGPGQGTEPKPILLVESVFQSAVLMGRIFRELNLLDQLAISMDCETALVRLRQPGVAKPRLILLDSRMPRMSAASFLEVVKSDSRLCMIPIVVLSNSDGTGGVSRYYELGAAGYMVHDGEYADILDKMRALCNYWMLSRSPIVY